MLDILEKLRKNVEENFPSYNDIIEGFADQMEKNSYKSINISKPTESISESKLNEMIAKMERWEADHPEQAKIERDKRYNKEIKPFVDMMAVLNEKEGE